VKQPDFSMIDPRRLSRRWRIAQAWKQFYATPEGREAIEELVIMCGVAKPVTAPIDSGGLVLAEAEGRRRIGLVLLNKLSIGLGEILKAQTDQQEAINGTEDDGRIAA